MVDVYMALEVIGVSSKNGGEGRSLSCYFQENRTKGLTINN
ncbi:hypothetical protein GXM_07164 [Nostoc sphaeroides CCNUC1]|uniref:Uncharacterized protein n=1 Tax=Nostoc sphaeroides CCNUC1 TaxID=2653204 RepID=A0A5P8WAG3_9NOSO|nr:hypothetical protein GXM_07164 [Nostoc sphaeroides CCNUC1]